ncbi:MAG: phosphonate ABC transporter substrate-binding protein [Alphaproteobacteria bacterium]
MTTRRGFLALTAAAAITLAAGGAHAADLKEINFGIISTESSANLKPLWTPFLADMEKSTGMKVNAFFATDYAGIIEAMRFNKVQVAWYGNAAAIQAVDRASGEVFVQSAYKTGGDGYYSILIVNKDSPIQSLQDIIKNPGKYSLGNGDPNSTSGFLIPSYYAWAQNDIDIRKQFTRIVTGGHEANLMAVANKQVDVATNNTENMERFEKTAPDKAKLIREIWRSPLIPSDPIVWRTDLSDGDKKKIKAFFLTYGTPQSGKSDAEVKRELAVLGELQWGVFKPSSNKQLIPIREVAYFRDKLKVEEDAKLSVDEKKAKISEIDAKLAELKKQSGT